jgi:hypothetical protein
MSPGICVIVEFVAQVFKAEDAEGSKRPAEEENQNAAVERDCWKCLVG